MLALAAGLILTPSEIVISEALAIPPVGQYGRAAVHRDAIEAMIVSGTFTAPKVGTEVSLPGGTKRTWAAIRAGTDGWFQGQPLNGGYVFATYDAPADGVILLKAAGHGMAYVNGVPRAGDIYGYGYLSLPVFLKQGRNELLFPVSRGRLHVALANPPAAQYIDVADPTQPDFVAGGKAPADAGIVVCNATQSDAKALVLRATVGDQTRTSFLPNIGPLTVRKVRCTLPSPPFDAKESFKCHLALSRDGETTPIHEADIELRVRGKYGTRKVTFVSSIDGSVQYYAVRPASEDGAGKALVLSLHGASVEALGQADAYSSKPWCYIVAPTNRRPYGFDWEDWGRMDALEVLALAKTTLRTADDKVYLTGHSMGGHGTWQIGAHYPGLFAAIGPSAGWISFASYTGAPIYANPTPVESMLMRAASASDTLQLKRNYLQEAIYVLHGDADDNVPVTEARNMAKELATFHKDWTLFEQPGAGHWWENSDEPGAECMDWPAMYDLFLHRRLPEEAPRHIEFTTVCPGISSRCHWMCIEQQEHMMAASSADIVADPLSRRFVGKTTNVARMSFDLSAVAAGGNVNVDLDGQKIGPIDVARRDKLTFAKADGKWGRVGATDLNAKGPHRYGPFKDAFRNRVVFVYGTRGTREENAWSYARARFDAESFYYRGNGAVDVIADRDSGRIDPERNLVVYGNRDCNSAWDTQLADSPIVVGRKTIVVGKRKIDKNDVACLFIRPRPGSKSASVGVVAGTSMAGLRLTERVPYFLAGVAFPDWILFDSTMLANGTAGIVGAGFFGADWKLDSGDQAWR